MRRLSQFFREKGLYTFTRWHTFFTNPPLCITESELREGFAIVDAALTELEAGAVAPAAYRYRGQTPVVALRTDGRFCVWLDFVRDPDRTGTS